MSWAKTGRHKFVPIKNNHRYGLFFILPMVKQGLLILLLGCLALSAWAQKAVPISAALLRADTLSMDATRYMLKGKHDSALKLLERSLLLAQQEKSDIMIAKCYNSLSIMQLMQGRYAQSWHYLHLAEPYLKKIDHSEIIFTNMMLRSNLYNFTGKKDSAIYQYKLAEQFADKMDPYRKYEVYIAMAELFNRTGDHAKAKYYYLQTYNLTSKRTERPEHGYILVLIINYFMTQNLPQQAAAFIAEYEALMEQRERKKFDDPMRELLRGVLDKRLESNVGFMQKLKDSALQNNQPYQAIVANTYLIRHYEKTNELEKALHLAGENESLVKATGQIEDVYSAKKIRYGLLLKMNRYEAAANLSDELFGLKDSILKLQNRRQVTEIETRYETQKKQKEIEVLTYQQSLDAKSLALLGSEKQLAQLLLTQEMLKRDGLLRENELMDSVLKSEQAYSVAARQEKEKQQALSEALGRENELKALQLKRDKATIWQLGIAAGLLLVMGFAIFGLYRSQKKKNALIQKQAADLEVLMQEIHHRVKNNLQVVSSLLDLQSHTISDAQASAAVKEGKNRVQSMALIHQNLYSEGNIKGIKVREYIQNLVYTLCGSYNITNDKVRVTMDIDDLNLDIDTMIPLGLVLNELVSNSFKYAFTEDRPGTLDILLKQQETKLHLSVSDNGVGFPETMDLKTAQSFGIKMIKAFAQKLKAQLHIYNQNGAVVQMQITKFKTA